MEKVLGLDLGTNSIGWAIVTKNDDQSYSLVDKGVNVFKEGVNYEKGLEKPAVQERTVARASRRHYFRRRLRKIELLKVLISEGFCPPLTDAALLEWRKQKKYPLDPDFMNWQRTDDNVGKNPYADRHRCIHETLDLKQRKDRYTLGRALYHLDQRRGFISNRKESSNSDDGTVINGINSLSERMRDRSCEFLGDYFYELYKSNEKIRSTYTDRTKHVRAEFDAICAKQNLPDELKVRLVRAIFFQRPLKSQKGTVGKCSFETSKTRCMLSHPRFEEFRMWCFLNNVKVKSYMDEDYRGLNQKELSVIIPLFFRKSSPVFDFEDIAKKIAGKGNYAYKDDPAAVGYKFNFRMSASVSGCPVMANLINAFESSYDNLLYDICQVYIKGDKKTPDETLNDIWHALIDFDDEDKLVDWLSANFQLDIKTAESLSRSRMPLGYASLSLKAINKILPYLKKGYRYDEAVFLGNVKQVVKRAGVQSSELVSSAEHAVMSVLDDYASNPLRGTTKENSIREKLADCLGIPFRCSDILYHPSMIETYPAALPDKNGVVRLGSPRTSSVRNPMAMRALFRLRILINKLLEEGKIDKNTKINIEFARGLNDANMRAAISRYQRELEKEYVQYRKEIEDSFLAETGRRIEATETDILKYKLWVEQGYKCLYTGKQIRISDFIGSGNTFDIEHTVPRSRGGDDAQVNKTLCENRFNREVKKSSLPSELANHDEILDRIESLQWQEKVDSIRKAMDICRRKSRTAESKGSKDSAIQQLHYLRMQLDYWSGKLSRFTMKSVPEGFSNRQGVDIGIIGKYAKEYLRTVFDKVYTVKGATTAEFRKMWGLQPEYTTKERVNHAHHCIDAITIACIGKNEYDKWAQYKENRERYLWKNGVKPVFDKPWPSFTEDVKCISDELLIFHFAQDKLQKQNKKLLKVKGKVQKGTDGMPLYVQGDTARASLHMDTFYGAIEKDGEIKYVIRKSVDSIAEKDIKNIVDDVVRQKVQDAVNEYGTLVKAAEAGIWMNKDKNIPIKKVRLFAPTVTSPLSLKSQRDISTKEYKRDYHVSNDGNYCMGVYKGQKSSFKIVTNLEAARFFNGKTDNVSLVPEADQSGTPLSYILKSGTMLLLYEKDSNEIDFSSKDISRRLYEVTGFSLSSISGGGGKVYQYGMITMKHHQESRRASDLKAKKGEWRNGEEYRPVIIMSHIQINALVQGYDFDIAEDGVLTRK